MVAGGGEAASIITKSVERLLDKEAVTVTERTVVKDVAEDAAKTAGRDAGEDVAKDTAGREAADAARDGVPGKPGEARTTTNDPIDVATGEVLLTQCDVRLPGVLPLVLERTHVSSYRQGRLFGISWASTLDQHLEVEADGVWYAAPDGTIQQYPPILMPGVTLAPVGGPVRPLTWNEDGGYTLHDLKTGRFLHFPPPGGDFGRRLPLLAISDRNGNRIDLLHDDGDLTEIRHSGGYRIAVDGDGTGPTRRITALRLLVPGEGDRGVRLLAFGYGAAGHLAEVTDSAGIPLTFTYDGAGRLTGWRDRKGFAYRYAYDERGRAVGGRGTGGFLDSTLTYDDGGRWTVLANSLGNRTTYHLNDRRQVVTEVGPLGNTVTSTWDDRDRLVARADALGNTTRFTWDDTGNLRRVERADGSHVTVAYNGLGLPVEVTDPTGALWRRVYDDRGNLIAVTDPLGATFAYGHDERGGLTTVTDPLGHRTTAELGPAGLPVRVTDPRGAVTRYTRDMFGRVVALTDPAGGVTRFAWTVEGRPASRVLPSGAAEHWEYDAEGNPISHTDALGQVSTTEYGPFDRPVARVAPDGARLEFGYDTELRLTSVTNPQGLVWRYGHDAAGRLIGETDFNGRELRYGHDAAGRLTARTNGAGETVHFRRDVLGNLVEERSAVAATTFAYDPAGRLVQATGPDAELRMDRDPLGRVVAETCGGRTLHSAYDALGNRTYRRTPSGAESDWRYDPAGHPALLRTAGQSIAFTYDAAGREVRRAIGGTLILDQQWDADHRLTSQALWAAPETAAAGPRLLHHRTYAYRADGLVAAAGDRGTGTRTFDLDRAGRVTAVRAEDWTERYAYDTAGNVTHATWPAGQEDSDGLGDREYAGTLIRRAGRIRYEHDAQGRTVRRTQTTLSGKHRVWRFTWDAADRLTTVITPDGGTWRYRYDPLGRRVAKQRLTPDGRGVAEQTEFVWDGADLAERFGADASSAVEVTTWDHLARTFRPVTQVRRGAAREPEFGCFVTDPVGSPDLVVDPAGRTRSFARSIWGAGGEIAAPGQYLDEESGLHYNFHRYFDAATARYQSADPLGLTPQPNPHAYVSNPLAWIDPLGLSPYEDFAHGTTLESANNIVENGLDATRSVENMAGSKAPGSFFTVPVDQADTSAALETAAFWGASRHAGEQHAVVVLRLPGEVVSDLEARGLLQRTATPFQAAFHPDSFDIIRRTGQWFGPIPVG